MKAELWSRAEDLFHAALERAPESRGAFLDEVCADNVELRRDVETLLSRDAKAGSFLEEPVLAGVGARPGSRGALLGRRLGPYRVIALLGAGGMGEVYRAHDERLDRDVAIKSLPPEFARDPARLARLRREARTLAALNHPNIASICGFEESPEADYLVLELVEGETPRGPLPLAVALDYASQVATALEAAHEHGIVHRDLKPANLKVTSQGTVKVLDFGLAKAIWGPDGRLDAGPRGQAAADGSVTGYALGTPAYMSPEQARGEVVDERADVWAFGCLLYELLAGTRAFRRDEGAATSAAARDGEPDWHALTARTPRKVRDLLRACLQRDANRRLQAIGDARAALRNVRPGRPRRGHAQGRRPSARIRSLAVLPLSNLAGNPEQDYFADGMTEALIAELAQIQALHVISRTSAMHYKATTKTVPEIARELGVDGVIEGSVIRAGDHVRITAQLVHAASDRHLWARTYERDLRDVLTLQAEVARGIADEIQVEVTPQERARLTRIRPVNVESHEAYVRGRYHLGRVHPERSLEHFRQAIAVDPDNALANAGIAFAQCMMFAPGVQLVPSAEVAPAARSAALRALELDESLAEPHVALASVLFWHDRDPVGAERELRRAIHLNPSSALAHYICALQFADLRRSAEAMSEFQRTLQLDPVSCWFATIAGFFMYELGQEEAGRRQMQKAFDLDPDFPHLRSLRSILYCYERNFSEAIAEAEAGVRLSSGLPMAKAHEAYALGMACRRGEARAILEQLEDLAGRRYVPASARAWCCMGLGDLEGALDWLEKGFVERDSYLPHLRLVRAFRPLDPDPRFQDLLRRLGLPP